MTPPGPIPGARERDEARFTAERITELALRPVRGNFNVAHLREINRRIFQDMPGAGYADVTPGEYRHTINTGDWMKTRVLETKGVDGVVAYSRMNAAAQTKLAEILTRAEPQRLAALDTKQFTSVLADIYANLDYIHPFPDGNSRTLRVFTRQLAGEAGFDLTWKRFAATTSGREALYIARDKSVNEIALPQMYSESAMRRVIASLSDFRDDPHLPQLLVSAIRPQRAIAFEQLPEVEALAKHPELKGAYDGMRKMRVTIAENFPNNARAQQQLFLRAKSEIVRTLDTGKVLPSPDQARARTTRAQQPTAAYGAGPRTRGPDR